MQALHIFMFVIAIFLFIDALPCVQSKVHTFPLKKKSIARRRTHRLSRRKFVQNVGLETQGPNIAYFTTISLGKEAQEIAVLIDTGSADLWVASSDCNSPACDDMIGYDSTADSNYKDLDRPFNVNYFKGSASGESSSTSFSLGGLSLDTQDFGLADNLSDDYEGVSYEGVMGMALSSASVNGQITPIENLKIQLDQPQFSVLLGLDESTSELSIGGSNQERYIGELSWMNLADNNRGHWDILIEDVILNGKTLNFQNRVATIDTGTTLIVIPIADAREIYNNIPKSVEQPDGTFSISCEDQITLGLQFNGVIWNVSPKNFQFPGENGVCLGAIQGNNDVQDTEWITGISFLKNVYSVFDLGKIQIGFGKLSNPI